MSMSKKHIEFLTGTLRGQTATRAATMEAAMRAFDKAWEARLGSGNGETKRQILLGEDVIAAHTAIGELMEPDYTEPEDDFKPQGDTDMEKPTKPTEVAFDSPEHPSSGASGKVKRKGRKSKFSGKKIYPAGEENPRRVGSAGWKTFELILANPGLTGEELVAGGGRLVDLAWDEAKGNVRLEA